MSWLSGWGHRKTISITGETGAGTDYQVDFSIGDGSGGDFHLESNCNSFPNDIQVTDNDQTTTLDYWVEDLTLDPIRMWIEVADDLGSNGDVCIYYGKSGESSASNGANTFLFFDDFDDLTGWTQQSGTWSVSGSELTCPTYFETKYLRHDTELSVATNYTIEWKNKSTATRTYAPRITVKSDIALTIDVGHLVGFLTKTYNSNPYGRVDLAVYHGGHAFLASNTYFIMQLTIKTASDTRTILNLDRSAVYTPYNVADFTSNLQNYFGFVSYDGGVTDWLLVRKYNSPEPAFSSAGSEENAPTEKRVYGYIFG